MSNLGYLKKVVEKLKEKGADEATIKKFQAGATNYYTNHIKPNFKDFDFYTGESMDPDGMCVLSFHWPPPLWLFSLLSVCVCVSECKRKGTDRYLSSNRVVLLNYREDGMTPFVTIWKYGLTEMKVWIFQARGRGNIQYNTTWDRNVYVDKLNKKTGVGVFLYPTVWERLVYFFSIVLSQKEVVV